MRTPWLATFALVWFPALGTAAEPLRLSWPDLVPQQLQDFDDPFARLDAEELSDLVRIARLRKEGARIGDGTSEGRELAETEAAARAKGLDVDHFFSIRAEITRLRREAAQTPNAHWDGTEVTLMGFALQTAPEAIYLVPMAGMCSHMPPPPPNQFILVDVPEPPLLRGLYTPVLVSGSLHAERSIEPRMVVDGILRMDAARRLDATDITPLNRRVTPLDRRESAANAQPSAGGAM